jgi:hypothetical protein
LQLTGVPLRPDSREIVKAVIKKRIGKDVGSLVWYDRLRCLFELRNSVIHYYPEIRDAGTFPGKPQDCMRKHGFQPGGDETMNCTLRVADNLQTIAIAGTSVTHAYRGDFFIEGAPDWEERS